MSVLTLLNIAISAVLAVWTVETFVRQPLRYRQAVRLSANADSGRVAEASALLTDSPLGKLMGTGVVGVLVAYLAGVILFRLDVDFALALVLATLFSGFFWLLEIAYLGRMRRKAVADVKASLDSQQIVNEIAEIQPLQVEYAVSFFPVLLAVLVLRSFLIEPFTIPSGSMLPTLEEGDYIIVNKFDYGLRLPVLGNKFVSIGEPQRGDVIVFHYPVHPETNFIKRLVGMPGDHIVINGNKVTINGKPLDENLESQDPEVNPWQLYYREQLGTHSHLIRQLVGVDGNDPRMQYTDVTVPQGQYFMMGDNRNESDDSRFWGFVPDRNLVGKAVYIWIHKDSGMKLPTFGRNGIVN